MAGLPRLPSGLGLAALAAALAAFHSCLLYTSDVYKRQAASRALGVEVERMRAENPELSGVRTEDVYKRQA